MSIFKNTARSGSPLENPKVVLLKNATGGAVALGGAAAVNITESPTITQAVAITNSTRQKWPLVIALEAIASTDTTTPRKFMYAGEGDALISSGIAAGIALSPKTAATGSCYLSAATTNDITCGFTRAAISVASSPSKLVFDGEAGRVAGRKV